MNKYLSDTTVAIEMLRGNRQAKEFLEESPEISIVTFAELIQGCKNKQELQIVKKTCEILKKVEINTSVSETAINLLNKYYLSHGLLLLDALIAATCIQRKKILISDNIKDFRFISELEVLPHSGVF